MKSTPVVLAEGLTNAELLEWMKQKIDASVQLQEATASREALEKKLSECQVRIEELTSAAAVEVWNRDQDPTLLPQYLGNTD